MDLTFIRTIADKLKTNIQQVLVGKDEAVDLLLVAFISSGHVLLEDVPGMGKTMLAKAMAKSLNCEYKRIQFTPDLLPSDLSGIHYFNQKESEFVFRPGPVFCNVLLADEINRATPRTQSSLLECMEERQVTIDGETKVLERPFLVIATQNPIENQGTFPLPEAQLDRFMIKLSMGYPTTDEGIEILKRFKATNPLEEITPVATAAEMIEAQNAYTAVKVSDDVLRYMLSIVEQTRKHQDVRLGVSPRGSQLLLRAVQVYAILQGRDYVIPDDIKALALPVLAHRMVLEHAQRMKAHAAESIILDIINRTAVPTETLLTKD